MSDGTGHRVRWGLVAAGWAAFVLGLIALGVLDYWLRMRDGNVIDGGLGTRLSQYLVAALGLAAAALVWRGSRAVKLPLRVALVALQALAGFVLYAFLAIGYVCEAGIDCF